jgi:hypothetical protein
MEALGQLEQTYTTDREQLYRARKIALLACLGIALAFVFVAIVGPIQLRRANNPEGVFITRWFGWGYVVLMLAIGLIAFLRVQATLHAQVEQWTQGSQLKRGQRVQVVRWDELKSIAMAEPLPYLRGGLLGVAFGSNYGIEGRAIQLHLKTGRVLTLPPALHAREQLFARIKQRLDAAS